MIFDFIKHAKQLLFDNSKSGLVATNTQDAIDELNKNKKLVQIANIHNDGLYPLTVNLSDYSEITVIVAYGELGANSATVPMEAFKVLPLNPNSIGNGGLLQYYNDTTLLCGGLTYGTVLFVFARK